MPKIEVSSRWKEASAPKIPKGVLVHWKCPWAGRVKAVVVECHLPGQPGKVHCREKLGLFFLDVGQRFVGFLEFDGFLLTLFVQESKILNHSVSICVLETEKHSVEHGVRFPNQPQPDPLLQSFFNHWKMGLRDLGMLSGNWFRMLDLLRVPG